MNRREFLGLVAKGSVGAAALGLAGCAPAAELADEAAADSALPEIDWEMPTSWPVALDTIFGGAQTVADRVRVLSGGRFRINPRAAGELVGGLEVLNAVEDEAVPIGHTASYYYIGKSPATAFGTSLPFGLNARQQDAWLYEGGGLDALQAVYRDRFNVIQFPAGNTGAQMGGWWNRELDSVAALQGLKVRIPGLGGQVMSRLGATVQALPGGEIFQALQTGAVDAAEWVGPYDDEKLGLNQAARFYYIPGWWEPGPTLEVQIGLNAWNSLPELYQEIMKTACHEANTVMLARYDALNGAALTRLVAGGTQLRAFSDDVLQVAREASFALYDEFAQQDADFNSVYQGWKEFKDTVQTWHSSNELEFDTYAATLYNT